MALIDDFKARFPEFDPAVVDQLFPPLEATWQCYYGGSLDVPCEKEAIMQLLAHLFVLERGAENGSGEAVRNPSTKSVGSVSISYAATYTSAGSDAGGFFGTTRYGQRFEMLTKHNRGPMVV